MSKITISRLFETSKYLATAAGKELAGALEYLSDFADVTLSTLRNGITFKDNIDCELRTVSVLSGAVQGLAPPKGKRVIGVLVLKVQSDQFYIVERFGWGYNSAGQISIICYLLNSSWASPSATTSHSIDLLLLFG